LQPKNFPGRDAAASQHEHLQGLVTFLAFVILQLLRPYFMPEMLMGLPSQSFVPDLKLDDPFGSSYAPVRFIFQPPTEFTKNRAGKKETHASEL
jgi:hypothetical protein